MRVVFERSDMEFIDETNERIKNEETIKLFGVTNDKIYMRLKILDTAKANAFLFGLLDLQMRSSLVEDELGIEILEFNYATGDLERQRLINFLENTIRDLKKI